MMQKSFVHMVWMLFLYPYAQSQDDVLNQPIRGPVLGLYSLAHRYMPEFSQLCVPSDRRIKTEVALLNSENMLRAIRRLKPVSFRYTDEWQRTGRVNNSTQIGFIAQELEEVFPEVVKRWQSSFPPVNGQMYSIEMGRLVPGLVSACQALDGRLADIQNKLGELDRSKKEIDKLKGVAIAALCCASLSVVCLFGMAVWKLTRK